MVLRTLIRTSATFLVLAIAAVDTARAEEAIDLLRKALDAAPAVPFSAKVKLSVDRSPERELLLLRSKQEGVLKTYLEVRAPGDLKDTRFLMYDRLTGKDEQWMVQPGSKSSVALTNETRRQDFLGSDFAFVDLVRLDLDAFNHNLVGEETLDGRVCRLIESTPKNPADEAYTKLVIAIDPKDNLIVRTLAFDANRRPYKTWIIDKWEKKDGHWTPTVQRMVNVQNGHSSRMELVDAKYNAQLPAEAFDPSYLTR